MISVCFGVGQSSKDIKSFKGVGFFTLYLLVTPSVVFCEQKVGLVFV